MEQILIYKPGQTPGIGEMVIGDTFIIGYTQEGGPETELIRTEIPSVILRAEQRKQLLGEDVVNIEIESAQTIDFQIGHRIDIFGETYTLNQLPTVRRVAERRFIYDLVFESVQYDLLRAQYFNVDSLGTFTSGEFSLTGDIKSFLDVLMYNIDRVLDETWELGDYPQGSAVKTLTFDSENCLSVLQRICQEYETEFLIEQDSEGNRTLHVGKQGTILNHTFEYGRGKGLYELKRESVNTKNMITRLYGYGSNKNLKSGYRNYSQRLKFSDNSYLDNSEAVDAFGVIEGSKIFEEIFPRREGTVTGVDSQNRMAFIDSAMDFDLNETGENGTLWLIPGTSAKVHFNTGNLAGYEFEISSYDHDAKLFQLIPIKDERGQQFPDPNNDAFQIDVGDKYVLLDINMPDSYVEAAETELQNATQAYLDQNSAPRVQYSLEVDETFLSAQETPGSITNFFALGDSLQIKDDDLNIDKASRIIGFTRDIINPYKYRVDIADSYEVAIITRLIADNRELQRIVKINELRDPSRARTTWRTTQELLSMIFDTDDYFKDGNIRPHSISTQMLAVGAKSQQFLVNAVIEPNYNGNANSVRVNAGSLVHYTIEDDPRTWNIGAVTVNLEDNNARYIYAKCNKADGSTEASVIFSTEQIQADEDQNYYHFLIGILHSVDDGVRWISLTYGSTTINGRFIKTGRIQSGDGLTYFDLDLGEIGGKIVFTIGEESKTIEEWAASIQNQLDGQIEQHFEEYNPTNENFPAAEWTTTELKEEHLGDLFYNTTNARVWRWVKQSTTYFWQELTDNEAAEALALANDALALAMDKRRIFTTTPSPPYEVGDLWAQGSTGDLMRCIVSRLSGNYVSSDWENATRYDNTKTSIDGGIVTSGRIQLAGPGGSILAGITGAGTTSSSIRIWAGASYENRAQAPFRVQQDGKVYMTDAVISGSTFTGSITATDGKIGDFRITSGMLDSIEPVGGGQFGIRLFKEFIFFTDTANNRAAYMGSNVLPFGLGGLARFENGENNPFGANYGIMITVENGERNIAAKIKGNTVVEGLLCEYEYGLFIPSSINGNVLPFKKSTVIVHAAHAGWQEVFLPSVNTIRAELGISGSFSLRFLITGYIDSLDFGLNGNDFTLKDLNAGNVSGNRVLMRRGDTIELLLYRTSGGNNIAQMIQHFR